MSQLDLISDHSKEKLKDVPDQVLDMSNLKMLFLEGNFLRELPGDLFPKLPRLVWLDLRNNLLESIPKSIAHHRHLENLLLSNNNIRELPNELGVVPNLKALQVSENPLVYPVRRIITEGTRAIKNYLKHEYERLMAKIKDEPKEDKDACPEDEQFINTVDIDVSSELAVIDIPTTSKKKKKREIKSEIKNEFKSEIKSETKIGIESEIESETKIEIKSEIESEMKSESSEDIAERVKKKVSDPHILQPTIQVRRIMPAPPGLKKKYEEPLKFVHKVSREGSKISLSSCFNRVGFKRDKDKGTGNMLKEGWLNQLRILLTDQERILQQERNLRALTDWRQSEKQRGVTPKTFYDSGVPPPTAAPAPYATYPEYAQMPTRKELATQLNDFLKDKGVSREGLAKDHTLNMEKLISDLMEQIKEMENSYSEKRTPRSEMEQAGMQIQTITDIHKKLLSLKKSNDLSV